MGTPINLDLIERQPFDGNVASFTVAPGTPNEMRDVQIDWGDGTSGPGFVVPQGDAGNFTIRGMHVYQQEGDYDFHVTLRGIDSGVITVVDGTAAVDDTQFTTTGALLTGTERTALQGVVATFGNTDPGDEAADFEATVLWGDGTSSPGTITRNSTDGFAVTGSHTYQTSGEFAVTVQIRSLSDTSTGTAEGTANVTALPPLLAQGVDVDATEGVMFAGTVGTFTDTATTGNAADYTARIDWGDGTMSDGTVVGNDVGGFDIMGTHLYAAQGSYPITITLSDVRGGFDQAVSPAAVVASDLQGVGVLVTGQPRTALQNVRVATFTDMPENEPLANYTVTVDWGDGTAPTPGTLELVDGTFRVTGTHTYQLPGKFPVKTTVVDAGGKTVDLTADALIGSANSRFVAQSYQDLFGRAVDNVGLAYWTAQLDHGLNRGQYVLILTATDEYRTKVLQNLYQTLLGRDLDSVGRGLFLNFLRAGGTFQQAQAFLLSSDEYFARKGGTNAGVVAGMFQDVLGRALDAQSVATIAGLLNQGLTRFTLATIVSSSNEAYRRVVQGFYQSFVRRDADQAGLSFYANALQNGARVELVIADIVGSNEYFARL